MKSERGVAVSAMYSRPNLCHLATKKPLRGRSRISQPLFFEEQAVYLENMHRYGGFAIGTLLVLHIGGALKHYLIDRDRLLQNMVRPLVDNGEPAK